MFSSTILYEERITILINNVKRDIDNNNEILIIITASKKKHKNNINTTLRVAGFCKRP